MYINSIRNFRLCVEESEIVVIYSSDGVILIHE